MGSAAGRRAAAWREQGRSKWLVLRGARGVQARTARHVRGERDGSLGTVSTVEEQGGGPIAAMHHSDMHPRVLGKGDGFTLLQGTAPLAMVLPVDKLARLLPSGVLPNLVAALRVARGAGWDSGVGGG